MKGVYCLLIKISKDFELNIGSIGNIRFLGGYYIYIGSAQNNLLKRIQRHISKQKKTHWHIDYLLTNSNAKISEVYYKLGKKRIECVLAKQFIKIGKPVINFGCSDCKCLSHLVKVKDKNFSTLGLKKLKINNHINEQRIIIIEA